MTHGQETTSKPGKGRVPYWLWATGLILVSLSWVPLVFFARARNKDSGEPRVQIVQDMGRQPKFKAEASSDVFADGRSMRPVIAGTVARGDLQDDDRRYRGYSRTWDEAAKKWDVTFHDGIPLPVSEQLLRRGQDRFAIYCSACHGLDGYGNGPVNQRAMELGESKWAAAKSLHDELVRARPDGHIFNTITNGIRNMPAHGPQIPVDDRWAIVAYVRALQLSQAATTRPVASGKTD